MVSEEKVQKKGTGEIKVLESNSSIFSDSSEQVQEVFKTDVPEDQVLAEVEEIIVENGLEEYEELLTRGALLANKPGLLQNEGYTDAERRAISRETTHPILSLSRVMIMAAICTSCAALNFGMDESAIGGAVMGFTQQFKITNINIQGLTVASPYLTAAIFGSPLAVLFNKYFGRKWVVFVSCLFGVAGSLIQAFANHLGVLLFARLLLGVGMGLNSAVVPIYTAECSPAVSRGAILMLWQMFIALGVCLGSVFNRAFIQIPGSASWRLMIGSSVVPPLVTGILIYFPPESPRWLLIHDKPRESLLALLKLRSTPVSGAKDFYVLYESLKYERKLDTRLSAWQQFLSIFTDKRNRFALIVSFIGVLGQQYGGVNILVSYTATILTKSGVNPLDSIAGSIGIGGGCFLSTFLSAQLIDRFGRRTMLLVTLPVEGACLFWLGGALNISENNARLAVALTAMYVYVLFYGTGIGPISFTLVAETPSISVREAHSAFCMALNWILDFVVSMSWPKMDSTMSDSSEFYFYAAFNLLLWVATFFCIPETKRYTLEQLDEVFKLGVGQFFRKKITCLPRSLKHWRE
ncbi:hypothetical protein ZYGR_0N07680 [Zygosaccharomyces rouxii]|uniref:Major facilitator superfamily (MFS) profile domain-containing protein n=1 Tax=Zygosaccharomyces rouxii TaxID=4956 RepID=A0A1Q3A102_ZYGRO|nr:hypothetical protein ZYGR_0N07680 [Zygosaccharomyces rouxii]